MGPIVRGVLRRAGRLWSRCLAPLTCPVKGYRNLAPADLVTSTTCYPAETLDWPEPRALGRRHWVFERRPGTLNALPAAGVSTLRDALVWGASSAVIGRDNKLLEELSIEFVDDVSRHPIFKVWRFGGEAQLRRAATISAPGAGTYYHWMFDVLPRIHLLQKSGYRGPYLAPGVKHAFQRETLELLGVDKRELIELRQAPVRVEELTAPSASISPGNVAKWKCEFLASAFLPSGTRKAGRRIYVRRGKAGHRKVRNEDDVVQALAAEDIDPVELDGMGVRDQARLFAQSELIVAPHGGGLTNLAFCDAGCIVVEVFAPDYVNECFWGLAARKRLDYRYLLGQGEIGSTYDMSRYDRDIMIDVAELVQAIRRDRFP